MAVINTVTAIAMGTPKGTAYQHTHFLRPAIDEDFLVEAKIMRFGKATAYADAKVTGVTSGKMIAHAVLEFAF